MSEEKSNPPCCNNSNTSKADSEIKKYVKNRYGEIAMSDSCCCSSSLCCGDPSLDIAQRIGYSEEDLENIPSEASMGLGCGNPVALASLEEGETVLDLGSGAGMDVFLAARKVGEKGKVIGVDMTEEMIKKARKTAADYGYGNVEFRLGEIEDLPLEDESIDVIISNCVINLAPDKGRVFSEAYRVLRPGGRLMVSDLVTEEELPRKVKESFDAWAGCVAGAMIKAKYLDTIERSGFDKVRVVSESTYDIDISNELVGKITSVQVEAYK
ncbi:arsenite methyltransferase [Candidatus Bathyarchaeota archaeon]|nr:arsenite methyltransferase [Candidatus Bathyarchaeota archaeon]